jgi:hypothetical protein
MHELIAKRLEQLLHLPLQSKADLSAWEAEAQMVVRELKAFDGEVPEDVWHFLADADIRSRPEEVSYRETQEAAVREFIIDLRRGPTAS